MPTVCNFCGSTNRSKARYCTSCAHPLPGFVPTGPSALDAVMAVRPSVDVDASAPRGGPAVPVLPAETAAFWLRAACLGVAMICGFTLWCLYVTHKPGAPPLQSQIMALLTPHTSQGTSAPPEESSTPAPSVESAQPKPPPQQQQQQQQAQQQRMSPNDALFPSPMATPVPETSAKTSAPPAARAVRPPNRTAAVRTPARSTAAAYDSRGETIDEPSAAATERALPRTSMAPDSGPPIVAGPGPQFERAPASRRTFNDPGPPVAIGPGPQYDYSRPPVRAPSLSSNDPGPPIAVGPGPQYDYSPRGSGSR